MQTPLLGGRPVPPAALVAMGAFVAIGCVFLILALAGLRPRNTATALGITSTVTPAARTAVPTILLSETPLPSNTPSLTPSEPPSASASPTTAAEVSASPVATATRSATSRPASTSAPATAVPASATPTATAPASSASGGSHGLTGQLSL